MYYIFKPRKMNFSIIYNLTTLAISFISWAYVSLQSLSKFTAAWNNIHAEYWLIQKFVVNTRVKDEFYDETLYLCSLVFKT
jgi:hypothetical protein